MPSDTELLTAEEAVDLARLRGEPERTITILASLMPYLPVINGRIFKQLCEGRREPLDFTRFWVFSSKRAPPSSSTATGR